MGVGCGCSGRCFASAVSSGDDRVCCAGASSAAEEAIILAVATKICGWKSASIERKLKMLAEILLRSRCLPLRSGQWRRGKRRHVRVAVEPVHSRHRCLFVGAKVCLVRRTVLTKLDQSCDRIFIVHIQYSI